MKLIKFQLYKQGNYIYLVSDQLQGTYLQQTESNTPHLWMYAIRMTEYPLWLQW